MTDITPIVVTSVLPSHPSTEIVDQTIASIRERIPKNEIILQVDGLRPEQEDRRADYEQYITNILWKCLHEYKNVIPVLFDEFSHQSTMMRETINNINTSMLLYVEGDAPLTGDIDFKKIEQFIANGHANTVRLHHEAVIPEPHKELMIGRPEDGFLKTIQWSQRPHVSTKSYYKNIVLPAIPEQTFIEDIFHGVVQGDYHEDGMQGWYKHRLWIYHPTGDIKRSLHLDGRARCYRLPNADGSWLPKQKLR